MATVVSFWKRLRGDAAIRRSEANVTDRLDALTEEVRALRLEIADLAAPAEVAPPPAKTTPAPSTRTSGSAWRSVAQEGELGYHMRPNVRSGSEWEADTDRKWRRFGFDRTGWDGKLIVDIGAGSRLRTKWFEGARIAAVEPLADRFIDKVEWEDLSDADEIYSTPAEDLIPELVGRADLVVSINALDHGYDFEAAIDNVRKYLKPAGAAFLSYDQHEVPDSMHPLVLNEEISRSIFGRVGLEVVRFTEAGRYHGGEGLSALNFWLRAAR